MKKLYITTFLLISFFSLIAQNNALNFDGNDDFVESGSNPIFDITSQISLEALVYPTQYANDNTIIAKFGDALNDDSYILRIQNGVPYFYIKINNNWIGVNATNTINLNTWYHIAGVYNGTTMKLFINGILNTTISQTGDIDVSHSTLKIGKWAGVNSFNGNIDEVRIWNIARLDSEILDNYSIDLTGNESGLVLYYNFNQGTTNANNKSQTTLTDFSVNNINGTLNNFQLIGPTSNFVDGVDFLTLSLVDNFNLNRSEILLFPNPAHEFIQFSGITGKESFTIYNILGSKIKNGLIDDNEHIDVTNFTNGVYFIKFKNRSTIKFVKQ
jgi:hypothetical protein